MSDGESTAAEVAANGGAITFVQEGAEMGPGAIGRVVTVPGPEGGDAE